MRSTLFRRLPLEFWLALLLPIVTIAAGAHMIRLAGHSGFTPVDSARTQGS